MAVRVAEDDFEARLTDPSGRLDGGGAGGGETGDSGAGGLVFKPSHQASRCRAEGVLVLWRACLDLLGCPSHRARCACRSPTRYPRDGSLDLFRDPQERYPVSTEIGAWGGAKFVRMIQRHMKRKGRYPDEGPAIGMPYEGSENLRPESKAAVQEFLFMMKTPEM